MEANATIAWWLTLDTAAGPALVCVIVREVFDIAPAEVHQYKLSDRNNKALNLPGTKLQLHAAIGEDGVVARSMRSLIDQGSFPIELKDITATKLPGTPAPLLRVDDGANPGSFNPAPQLSTLPNFIDCWGNNLDALFHDLQRVEAHQRAEKSRVFPADFVRFGAIREWLEQGCVLAFCPRGCPHWFHGKKRSDGQFELQGFVQANENFRNNHEVRVLPDASDERKAARIDPRTGKWSISYPIQVLSGQIQLWNTHALQETCSEPFRLFGENLRVTSRISIGVLQDPLGKTIYRYNDGAPESETTIAAPGFYWSAPVQGDQSPFLDDLAEKLAQIIQCCSPMPLIVDMYAFGNLAGIAQGDLNPSQSVFISALFRAAAQRKISHLHLLARRKLTKNVLTGNAANSLSGYAYLAQHLKRLDVDNFSVRVSSALFHDRILMGNQKDGCVYRISSSVTGLAGSGELRAEQVTDKLERARLRSRYLGIWNASESIDALE